MSRFSWMRVVCFPAWLFVVTPGMAQEVDQPTSCKQIDAWVQSHVGALPALYDDFVTYPMNMRRRIFPHLLPEAQAALWRTHLARALETERALNEEQRALLAALIPTLTGTTFVKKELPVSLDTIRAAFPDDGLLRRLFYYLGPTEPPNPSQPTPDYVNICTCDSNWWFADPCPGTEDCVAQSWDVCVYQATGCGFLGWWACDGLCCDYGGGYCH